jgi:hypothetical protein
LLQQSGSKEKAEVRIFYDRKKEQTTDDGSVAADADKPGDFQI